MFPFDDVIMQKSYSMVTWASVEDDQMKRRLCPSPIMKGNRILTASRIRVELIKPIKRRIFVCTVQRRLVMAWYRSWHPDRYPGLTPDHTHTHTHTHTYIYIYIYIYICDPWVSIGLMWYLTTRWSIRVEPLQFYGLTLDSSANITWDQCSWIQSCTYVSTFGGVDDDRELVWGICLDVLSCYWGFYKIWSTRPSPRPNLRGRNCPLPVMGVKVSLVCSNNTVFSPHGYIFPIRWRNQLNQSERLIYAPLAWITTDPGNGLVYSLCQAIAWINFDS